MEEPDLRRVLGAIDERIRDAEGYAKATPDPGNVHAKAENAVWHCAAYQRRQLRAEVQEIAETFEPVERPPKSPSWSARPRREDGGHGS
jgi:hypothetical protein